MLKKCSIDWCDKMAVARGYCATHYANFRRLGTPIPPSKDPKRKTCYAKGCSNRIVNGMLCAKHRQRLIKYGELEPSFPKMERNGLAKDYPSEHDAWRSAKGRCLNRNDPQFSNYGGRGIKFCDRWQGGEGFKHFIEDMGPKPSYDKEANGRSVWTLDRIDYNGDYCPENCRWVDRNVQNNNRRSVIAIEHQGKIKTLSEWGKFFGLPRGMLYQRYQRGERGSELFRPPEKNKNTRGKMI